MHGSVHIKSKTKQVYHFRPPKRYTVLLVSNHTSERCILLRTYWDLLFVCITFYFKLLNTCLYKLKTVDISKKKSWQFPSQEMVSTKIPLPYILQPLTYYEIIILLNIGIIDLKVPERQRDSISTVPPQKYLLSANMTDALPPEVLMAFGYFATTECFW